MVTKVRLEKPITNTTWLNWCKSLLDLYGTEKQFSIKDQVHSSSYLGMKRWILAQSFSGTDLILRNLLLDAMSSANVSPGAESYVPWFLYNPVINPSYTRHGSKEYLINTLNKTKNDFIRKIFRSVYHAVGPLTKIIIKASVEPTIVIKPRESFRFPLSLDMQFHKMIGHVEFIEQTNPIVIMIEGAPETVGEINSLLERNHDTKRAVILIARSFPEEISATLATNWLRGSLTVLPFIYGNELETINLAADLCAITQGELISAHFGDVISIAISDEAKWGSVERIEWTSQGLSLYKEVDVSYHMKNLINKLEHIENEDLKSLLQERVLSLSNDAIEVWIPKDEIQILEELDSLIKHYNAFVVSGAVETPLGYLPKSFVDAAQSAAQTLRKEIVNIGGFLVRVDDEVVVRRRR